MSSLSGPAETVTYAGNIHPHASPEIVEAAVTSAFADTPALAHVARCESRFRHLEKNGNVLRGVENSRDVGVMQINERYHLEKALELGYDIYSLDGNMAYAQYLYEKQGLQPWSASKPCWGKYLR